MVSENLIASNTVDLSGKVVDDFSGDLSAQDFFQTYSLVSGDVLVSG